MNRYFDALFKKHKKKHLPGFLTGTWFDEWMSYGYITFTTSFILQGMLYANWRDNVIKIGMDVVITAALWAVGLPWWVALLIAHTINYCINGQAICVFYHLKAGNMTAQKFYDETVAMKKRLDGYSSISGAVSYGSLGTGKWHNSSDLDIRFVPAKGEWNYWKACFAGLRERTIAFFHVYPLDMYIFTMAKTASTMKKGEKAIVFKDANDEVKDYFDEQLSFEGFQEMFTKLHLTI